MDLILPIISNIGLLALAAVVYSATPGFRADNSQLTRSTVLGLGLGLTAAMVMLMPIELAPGVVYDARNAPLLLSGILGGPVTALVSVIPPILMRTSIGGTGMVAGIVGMLVVALCSVIAWAIVRRRAVERGLPALLAYAAVSTIIALPSIMLIPDEALALSLLKSFGPVIVLINVSGTVSSA